MAKNLIEKSPLFRLLKLTPATQTVILAAVVGVLGGFGCIGFKKLIFAAHHLFWLTDNMAPDALMSVAWYRRLLMPLAGGLVVGPLIYFLAREAKGHGVPEVMIAVIRENSVIRPVVVLVKSLASALSISSGGSVGREGPIVQIGAAFASTLGQVLKVRPEQLKTLVGCGVAAGIAGTFNAPIAGTLFSLELIVSDFGLTAFTPILVSAVASTAVTRYFYGTGAEFALPHFTMASPWEFGLYILLAAGAGLVGYIFSRSIYVADDVFAKSRIPAWVRPAAGGLLIGVAALFYPHVMGVGYDTIHVLFEGNITLAVMAILVVLKLLATAVTIGSGGSGGIFAPSLFIGAMLGGTFGALANQVFPGYTAPLGAYALVGMGAVNGACTLAPLSAIIIIVELTDNYTIILPLMLTVVIATFISRKLSADSIYTEKLSRRGIQAHRGEDLNVLRAIGVRDVMRRDQAYIGEDASLEELIELALESHRNVIFTHDGSNRYTGVVSIQDIKHILHRPEEFREPHVVSDLRQDLVPVFEDQSLDMVVDRFAETGFDRLPVVNEDMTMIGSVVAGDLMRQYNQEVASRNMAMELGARVTAHDGSPLLQVGDEAAVAEVAMPLWMAGRTARELQLRNRYHVTVFMVKECHGEADVRFVTPGSSYVFREGDRVLVGGKKGHLEAFIAER